jgi:putative ATP-dependent endonuclease of OLD family
MFISQFCAFNYRSLKHIQIRLSNGKNVIVGKNNCGKSNIIKAIEVLVGEKFPTYQNITNNDFYTYEVVDEDTSEVKEIVADNMYLEATLEGRDLNESLIMSIKKQTAFSKIKESKLLYYKQDDEMIVNFDLFQSLDDLEHREEVAVLETFTTGKEKKTEWKTASRLYEFLRGAKTIKVFFCKSRIDEEKVGFGLIIKNDDGIWISHFLSKKLRDSLLTTTVISALRSHKDELRLVHYTWFGKLIAGIWNKNKVEIDLSTEKSYETLIRESSDLIKAHVDIVFSENTAAIRKLLEGAIAHKSVSFKLLDDGKNDMYKNVQVFINDGIDRPINEKGTGIQSAVIIALFSLYCDSFHTNSSLLIAEEPELFLHPQARRVISAELNKFIEGSETQERQLIISTHSTEYLKNVDPLNITRVYKDLDKNCSIAKQLNDETSKSITTELKRFLWSNNTEIFFADKVVLVEGGEVYLLPPIIDKIKGTQQLLDYENISVARVNGKGNFLIYSTMLRCFNIEYLILGDLDCFKDEVSKFVNFYKIESIKDSTILIKQALSDLPVDYGKIQVRIDGVDKNTDAQKLEELFNKFTNGEIERDDIDLIGHLRYMQSRYTKGDKTQSIIDKIGEEEFQRTLKVLRDNYVFIWSKGELESYYKPATIQIRGSKDIKALELSYKLPKDEVNLNDHFKHLDEIELLCEHILQ